MSRLSTLTRGSHSLKGSSFTLGAKALGSVCQEPEKLGHDATLNSERDTLARAQQEFARRRAVLGVYVARADGATARG